MKVDGTESSVILDCGTGSVKAGFAGDKAPTTLFTSVVGHPKYTVAMVDAGHKESYVGWEAQSKRGVLDLRYPVKRGIVQNWEDMERVWHHTFHVALRVNPEERGLMLTEPPLTPRANSEKTAEIMFETFSCPALHLAAQSELALYSSGRVSGVVVDSGEGVTHVTSVYQGYYLPQSVVKVETAGEDVTRYLEVLLNRAGCTEFTTSAEREIVRDIKERMAFTAVDPQTAISDRRLEKTYTLPDGQTVSVAAERFQCSEVMFNPGLLGQHESPGIHAATYHSLINCDIDTRSELYRNIFLVGGNTKLSSMDLRLRKELKYLLPSGVRIGVTAPPERKYSVWIGGSILASLITFGTKIWIPKLEYEEYGPSIVHRLKR